MTTRHDLTLEEKIQLIRDNNDGNGLSFRKLADKYRCSIGSISNILKRKQEYLSDYETNGNKDTKRKLKDDNGVQIDRLVFEWFSCQRAKNIPISGPILQERARQIAEEIGIPPGQFKGSNGWLEKFRARHSINHRAISGESASVDQSTIDEWKRRLPSILNQYKDEDVFNVDETGLFYKAMPDRSLVCPRESCKGGKKSKERYTVMLCSNSTGTEKLKPLVIGKSARPRCFGRLNIQNLPVQWKSNRTAWMNALLFTEWLDNLNQSMKKKKRKILLFLDNAPCHPPDAQFSNVKLQFFPPNTTSQAQPLDQGIIQNFKTHYRKLLIKHVIARSATAQSTNDIVVNALDAIHWIHSSWKSVTETTIRNTFLSAGFLRPQSTIGDDAGATSVQDETSNNALQELDALLEHVVINGRKMDALEFVQLDLHIPSCNEWDDVIIDSVNVSPDQMDEDVDVDEDQRQLDPPKLSEAMEMLDRLRLLSTTAHPQLHPVIAQLECQLTDIYLESKTTKQSKIDDFFQRQL